MVEYLGHGEDGIVFKATFGEGSSVAVKIVRHIYRLPLFFFALIFFLTDDLPAMLVLTD